MVPWQVYLPGDTIVHEGDAGKQLFFIGRGKVKVMSGDRSVLYAILKARPRRGGSSLQRRLAWLSPPLAVLYDVNVCVRFPPAQEGHFFGEIETFTKQRRTASIVASTYCDLYVIDGADIEEARRFPFWTEFAVGTCPLLSSGGHSAERAHHSQRPVGCPPSPLPPPLSTSSYRKLSAGASGVSRVRAGAPRGGGAARCRARVRRPALARCTEFLGLCRQHTLGSLCWPGLKSFAETSLAEAIIHLCAPERRARRAVADRRRTKKSGAHAPSELSPKLGDEVPEDILRPTRADAADCASAGRGVGSARQRQSGDRVDDCLSDVADQGAGSCDADEGGDTACRDRHGGGHATGPPSSRRAPAGDDQCGAVASSADRSAAEGPRGAAASEVLKQADAMLLEMMEWQTAQMRALHRRLTGGFHEEVESNTAPCAWKSAKWRLRGRIPTPVLALKSARIRHSQSSSRCKTTWRPKRSSSPRCGEDSRRCNCRPPPPPSFSRRRLP